MLIGSLAFASNSNENATLELKSTLKAKTTLIKIDFDSLEGFNSFDFQQLNIYKDQCTVSISVTVSVGVGSTYVSATLAAVGVPCDEVGARTKKLKEDALAALK